MTIKVEDGSPIGPVYYNTTDFILGTDQKYGKDYYYLEMAFIGTKFLISKETFEQVEQAICNNVQFISIKVKS